MPLYENVFIARQDISGAQVDALADGFTQLIAEQGGEIKKREYWGLRNLAYRMKKNRKGHYVLFNIEAPPAAIAELERTMRINEDVLRYLTLRVDQLEEGPSPVMQSRGSREDRPRRDRDRYERYEREPEAPPLAERAEAGAVSRPPPLCPKLSAAARPPAPPGLAMNRLPMAMVAVLCGGVSACLYLALLLSSPGAMILVYLTQLPLFFAGLWFGVAAAAIAGLSGAAVLFAASDLLAAAIFAALNAVPVVVLVRQALLARRDT